ncbi:carbon storage regulator [Pseudomonas carnis]|uniref:carbon storage regulator n=1 Tax=Pseudomonas carnis TaxID=2487355 RepID=UPI000F58BEBE|nr:carbon storage regulator [Pseudomonas carnis]
MLVLTRTPNLQLRLGREIQIKVIKVDGDSVYLAIEAPKHASITRSMRVMGCADDRDPITKHARCSAEPEK